MPQRIIDSLRLLLNLRLATRENFSLICAGSDVEFITSDSACCELTVLPVVTNSGTASLNSTLISDQTVAPNYYLN